MAIKLPNSQNIVTMPVDEVRPEFLMMAAADMDSRGRLFEPLPIPGDFQSGLPPIRDEKIIQERDLPNDKNTIHPDDLSSRGVEEA